jgi:hypothetical protein
MNGHLRRATARETGVCMDCPAPVDGKRGLAIRCATCRRRADRATGRRFHENHGPRRRSANNERKRLAREARTA